MPRRCGKVPKVARGAGVIDTEVDEVTEILWADVADDLWVGLAVRVVDVVSYPDLSGQLAFDWHQRGMRVLAGVEFAELYPDEIVPLLADEEDLFWAAVVSSPEVLRKAGRTR